MFHVLCFIFSVYNQIMKKNFPHYIREIFDDFFEMSFNLFIFLPYFFSALPLMRTLFAPWKNLAAKREKVEFSFQEMISVFSFNLISRIIGCVMRISILVFYLLMQTLYGLSLPILFLYFILSLPLRFLIYSITESEEQKKLRFHDQFVKTHLLDQTHAAMVDQWFEWYFQNYYTRQKWWKLSGLFSIPPLARDWAVGYTPTLDRYAEELTDSSYQARIKAAINRKQEILQIERTLSKNEEANVVIVGEEGVGKHTVIDALAKKIYEGRINPLLMYKRVLKLNMESILSQSTDQKQREYLLETLLDEASQAKNIILMIENLDKYTSSAPNKVDLTLILEKYGKKSALQFIATTTPFFYQTFIFPNEKIRRIFTKIDVNEIGKEEATTIILHAIPALENRYGLVIPYETAQNALEKSEFYITYIPFPEKTLDLLENACIHTVENRRTKDALILNPEIIDTVLTEKTHIPTTLTDTLRQSLLHLEERLSESIIQQKTAVKKLSDALSRSFVQLGKRKKPLASFLFLGPTGVGKTETAKALARLFFGGESNLIRFDMSLYQTKEEIPHLVGSADGSQVGLLTKALRENPYALLLLDEIEKADKDLLNIFLTLLDEGYFTDGMGSRVDCKNFIVIATSNAASDRLYQQTTSENSLIDYLIENRIFSPEFLNRFDGIIAFDPLSPEAMVQIAKQMIQSIADNLHKLYGITVQVSDTTIADIVKKNIQPKFGARNLQRLITEELESNISKLILENKIQKGQSLML